MASDAQSVSTANTRTTRSSDISHASKFLLQAVGEATLRRDRLTDKQPEIFCPTTINQSFLFPNKIQHVHDKSNYVGGLPEKAARWSPITS